jgi:hypothetical protein
LLNVKFEITVAIQESRLGVDVYDMKAKKGGNCEKASN